MSTTRSIISASSPKIPAIGMETNGELRRSHHLPRVGQGFGDLAGLVGAHAIEHIAQLGNWLTHPRQDFAPADVIYLGDHAPGTADTRRPGDFWVVILGGTVP